MATVMANAFLEDTSRERVFEDQLEGRPTQSEESTGLLISVPIYHKGSRPAHSQSPTVAPFIRNHTSTNAGFEEENRLVPLEEEPLGGSPKKPVGQTRGLST